mmetsp:Transcript_27116/g.41269  ORF Transcript_27116/g.41269 Transcript_27116/m.41269 type:complete len:103 (-) Transcript_27116:3144-3452(-)
MIYTLSTVKYTPTNSSRMEYLGLNSDQTKARYQLQPDFSGWLLFWLVAEDSHGNYVASTPISINQQFTCNDDTIEYSSDPLTDIDVKGFGQKANYSFEESTG